MDDWNSAIPKSLTGLIKRIGRPVINGFHHVAFYSQNGIGHPNVKDFGAQSLQLQLLVRKCGHRPHNERGRERGRVLRFCDLRVALT